MAYEIIFLDIDGTLTNSKKEITPKTRDILIEAQQRGFKVAIASGRPDHGVIPMAKELKLDRFGGYILPFNGGRIRNFKTGETVYQRNLMKTSFELAYKFAKKHGVDIITYQKDCIISETKDNKYLEIESRINNLPIKVVDNLLDYVDFDVPKCLLLGDGDILAKLEPELREIAGENADVFRSEPFFLEVMPKNTDKATSIEKLIEQLGIEREDTIACGDGYNDITMIKYAGLGVAMENACEMAKSVADYVTLSNEDDGIAKVVEKFMCSLVSA